MRRYATYTPLNTKRGDILQETFNINWLPILPSFLFVVHVDTAETLVTPLKNAPGPEDAMDTNEFTIEIIGGHYS